MKNLLKKTVVAVLTGEAQAVLKKYRPKIVAVTGSVGKTATKDAIYAVVARGAHARKSEKSFNSEIGIPLTILGAPNAWDNPLRWLLNFIDGLFLIFFTTKYPEWLVLEVGADRPGDIKNVASWLPVDIAVITRLPEMPVHVEFFDSPEEVVEEKAALVGALKHGGTLVLFGDDGRSAALSARTGERVLTFGFSEKAEVRGGGVTLLFEPARPDDSGRSDGERKEMWPIGMSAHLTIGGTSAPISILGGIGAHTLLPLLAGAAVGHALGKNISEIVESLKSYEPPPGRMRLLRGIKDTLIIDDTYNSSPAAVIAALDTLALVNPAGRKITPVGRAAQTRDIPPGRRDDLSGRAAQERGITPARRIAVLGDMLELGRHSTAEHRKIGEHAAKTADMLLTIGFRAREMAQGALDNGMPDAHILQYEDAAKAGAELENILREGDCVLVKGSQSMRMERVVEEIMLEPERATELLVRQDEEWKRR